MSSVAKSAPSAARAMSPVIVPSVEARVLEKERHTQLHAALEKLKAFLDSEERALENLDLFTRRQTLGTGASRVAGRNAAAQCQRRVRCA